MTSRLTYYLSESQKGDRTAAYEAGRMMAFEKYNDVLIQNQYRRSAELGFAPAQRELGILGICSRLVTPSSSIGNMAYYNDNFAQAIYWLKEASKKQDGFAIYLLGKCYQLGIGVEADDEHAGKLFDLASKLLPLDKMLTLNVATSLIIDNITLRQGHKENIIEDDLLALVG